MVCCAGFSFDCLILIFWGCCLAEWFALLALSIRLGLWFVVSGLPDLGFMDGDIVCWHGFVGLQSLGLLLV